MTKLDYIFELLKEEATETVIDIIRSLENELELLKQQGQTATNLLQKSAIANKANEIIERLSQLKGAVQSGSRLHTIPGLAAADDVAFAGYRYGKKKVKGDNNNNKEEK